MKKLDEVLAYIDQNKHNVDEMRTIRLAAQKAEKSSKPQITKTLRYTAEAGTLATKLTELVRERYPYLSHFNVPEWANDIDKINRIDGFDWDVIEGVLIWSQQDTFWRQQIRSGANLRKHFEKMLVKVHETSQRKGRVHSI